MLVRPALGIRIQVILLAAVPLAFLALNLGLIMVLERDSEQSALLSHRVARIHQQSDLLLQAATQMNRSLVAFSKSRQARDVAGFRAAESLIPSEAAAMEDLVRGSSLAPPAERYLKALRGVVAVFSVGLRDLQAGHMQEVIRLGAAPTTKALGVEFEQSRVRLSAATATILLTASTTGIRRVARVEQTLLITASLGVAATIVLAVLFGVRLVHRLGILADNARRLAAGEVPAALRGSDEVTQLDGVYRSMFAATVEANRELERRREVERAAKLHLERSVRAYGDFAAQVAGGNLSARVAIEDPNDELGALGSDLNDMAASLERLDDEIRAAAASLASAATEILASTSQQVSFATEEATAVRQTAATVREVRQTAEVAARKTKMVAELAQRVEQTAASGRQSVEENVRGSEGAKERMEVLAERIVAFSDQAQAIAEINATVATLAEQSNLLAVNAGIEAAKAGEAGRGFAVVAAEVKELGARSKEATVQVRRIIVDIQRSAQNAVIAAEQGMKAAENGTAVAQRSGEAMDILTTSISEASDAAQQINASAEQQQIGMDQIAVAMQQIEQVAVQTVAATQQVEAAANDLNRLAGKLTETIQRVRSADVKHASPAPVPTLALRT